jgi:hypothetical protein
MWKVSEGKDQSCDHDNESSGSIKGREQLNDSQTAPWG